MENKYKFIVADSQFLHITHNDADAVGCALVIEYLRREQKTRGNPEDIAWFPFHSFNSIANAKKRINMIIKLLSGEDVTEEEVADYKIITYGKNYPDYGVLTIPANICISDISIEDSNILHRLNELSMEYNFTVIYVDHHESSKHNQQLYRWCHTQETDEYGQKRSACKYLYDIFVDEDFSECTIKNFNAFKCLIDDISRYDTWLWKTDARQNPTEHHTTILLQCYGGAYAVFQKISTVLFNGELLGKEVIQNNLMDNPEFNLLITNTEQKKELCIKRVMNNVVYDMGYKLGFNTYPYATAYFAMVILPDEFNNDIMEEIYSKSDRPIDVVMGFYPATRSFSFRHSPSGQINLNELAATFGGGGHPDAAGAKVDTDTFFKYLSLYYDLLDNKRSQS